MIKSLKIGSDVFQIVEKEYQPLQDPKTIDDAIFSVGTIGGDIVIEQGIIHINKDSCEQAKMSDLCHEYAHGWMGKTGITYSFTSPEEEEKWAQFIGMCIVEFITANPEAIEMIYNTLCPEGPCFTTVASEKIYLQR